MKFYSTHNRQLKVSLRDALFQGLAEDNGLFMPEFIPVMSKDFFDALPSMTLREISIQIAKAFFEDDIPADALQKMVLKSISFDAPLARLKPNLYALELFHGPTMAFKDFGAMFMSQVLGYFASKQEREVTVLVATSGDTGSAVANGFLGVSGTRVVILYPSGKVSDLQEKQFTTLGENIFAFEVDGTFDDCQRMVKNAFLDDDLRRKMVLTSANSINICRLIPQTFYFFYAYSKILEPIVFSVPSGNFGNLTAGLIAKKMGLPVRKFIAATNINDVIPEYLTTKVFRPRASRHTVSNAMDVGNPSNFVRMLDLYDNDFDRLSGDVTAYAFTDQQTTEAIRSVYRDHDYLLDPHGAVAYLGLTTYMRENDVSAGVFFETAHAAKFIEVTGGLVGDKFKIPPRLEKFLTAVKESIRVSNAYGDFKKKLIQL